MDNTAKILAMSILAILKNYNNDNIWLYFGSLEKIRKFNRETKVEINEEGDEIVTEIIIDEKLEKIIAEQESILSKWKSEKESILSNKDKTNKDLIKTIESILREVLGKELEEKKDNLF